MGFLGAGDVSIFGSYYIFMNSSLLIILSAVVAAVVVSLIAFGSGLTGWNRAAIIFLAVVSLGVVWLIVTAITQYQKRRLEEMVLAGAEVGLQLDEDKPGKNAIDPKPKYGSELAKKNAQVRYLFVGAMGDGGRTVRVFQHMYMVSAGQTAYPVYHRAGYVAVPKDWPTTRICTKKKGKMRFGTWKKRKAAILETEEFNKRFIVKSFDPEFAIILVNIELQEALLRMSSKKAAWHIEAGRLWYIEKGGMSGEGLRSVLEGISLFADYIHPALWEEGE